MIHIRWYDQDENMKLLINILEKLSEDAQNSIAEEIIQLLMQRNIDSDSLIEKIEYVPNRHRWYDKNETLHSAIKMLKKFSGEERKEVFSEIFTSMFDLLQQMGNSKK